MAIAATIHEQIRVHVIHSVAELDDRIAACDRAEAVSDDALRAALASFRMEVPQDLPPDALSDAYRAAQMALYTRITGVAYSLDREATVFDVDRAVQQPFPFYTGSSATAGEYFMAIGFVLQAMALPPCSRVLEFGPGWGHTALWLAQLGHAVTVVEIEPHFCDLIARRATAAGVSIEIVNGDFFTVEREARVFDAVLFYDCFHHCADHLRLLRALTHVVAPNGRVFFGAEPIVADFPQPWGLRLDGWALWGVRKHGWMELGFRDDYFAQALRRTGWFGRKIALAGMNRLRVWEARHIEAAAVHIDAADPRIETRTGQRQDGRIVMRKAARGTGLFGPYLALPQGAYVARIGFEGAVTGRAVMDVTHGGGRHSLAKRPVSTAAAELPFEASGDLEGVEVRLFTERGFTATVAFVEVVPREAV